MVCNRTKKILIICSILVLSFSGCKSTAQEKTEESSFEIKVASNLIDNYMIYLMKGDKEAAKGLSTDELQKSSSQQNVEDLPISGYKVDEVNEVGKGGIFRIKVTRNSGEKPFSELDEYVVKVIKQGESYKISEITSTPLKEAYGEGDSIRVRSKTNVKTNLLVDIGGVPGYAFSKDDKARISKITVPKVGFGMLCLSYSGDSVLISTMEKNSYAGILKIDESMSVQGKEGDGGGKQGGDKGGTGAAGMGGAEKMTRETPIGKELTSLDILKDSKIDLMLFSPSEKFIVIQYKKNAAGKCIRLYRTDNGDLVPFVFEENFPVDKVNIIFSSFSKDTLNFEVSAKSAGNTSVADYLGKWQIDLKEFKPKKM